MKTISKSYLFATLVLVAFLCAPCAVYLTGCANPNGTSALISLGNAAVAYASGNDVGAGVDAISAAAYGLRTLQGTSSAASPSAVATVMTTGASLLSGTGLPASGSKSAANVVSKTMGAINSLVSAGATAAQANEIAAEVLDAAVAQATKTSACIRAGFRPDIEAFMLYPVIRLGIPRPPRRVIIDESRPLRRDGQSIATPV